MFADQRKHPGPRRSSSMLFVRRAEMADQPYNCSLCRLLGAILGNYKLSRESTKLSVERNPKLRERLLIYAFLKETFLRLVGLGDPIVQLPLLLFCVTIM